MDPVLYYSPGPLADDNMGGLCELRYARADAVTACPPPVQNVCTSDITLDTNVQDQWLTLPITVDSASFDEAITNGPNGSQYRVSYSGVLAKVTVEALQLVNQVQRHKLIVEVQDNNGLWRRIGDLRNPCRLRVDETLGGSATARNGFTLAIDWLNDEPAPFVDTSYVPDFEHLESSTSGSGGGGGGA